MSLLLSFLSRGRKPRSPFEKKKRAAARIALYGSLASVGLALGLGAWATLLLRPEPADMPWIGVDYGAMPEVDLLARYLQIDTSQPNANEEAGALFLAEALEAAGLEPTIERMGDGHANLWALLEGESPQAVVLHSHIDTDPVPNPEGWEHPPFSGFIDSPYLYGRGAYDMKSVTIAQLMAITDLAKKGVKPKRSVLFLATGSEEVGSDLGTRWILNNRPDLADRFWVFLSEGGVVETRSFTDIIYWGTEFVQKRYVDVTVCYRERGPMEELRKELLRRRDEENFQVDERPEVSTFLASYAPTRHRDLYREMMLHPEVLRLSGPEWAELPLYVKAMFRDDLAPFPIEESEDGTYRMLIKFRLLPGSDFEEVRERLLPEWLTYGMAVSTYDEGGADGGSPLTHPAYEIVQGLLRDLHPEAAIGPLYLPGTATDSRFTRARRIPSFGISPFLMSSTETYRIGHEDERIYLPGYVDGVGVYRELVRRLVE